MPVERRKPQRVNAFRLTPDVPRDGPFAGYSKLDAIHSAARRDHSIRFCNLLHHLNGENLAQAFRTLDGTKASGIDGMTKRRYERKLPENLQKLNLQIQKGGWRPRPAREVLIPKATGGWRPLAVGCLEDKIVQGVLAKILEAIYEPVFHERSYGFRPGRSAHHAIARLYQSISRSAGKSVVVEMDIEKFFNHVSHEKLMAKIEERIGDPHFLRLIRRCLRNSILSQDGNIQRTQRGTPQGSPLSPVLANIYLHYFLDKWFEKEWSDEGEMVRYADDAVFVFSDWGKARAFQSALQDQLVTHADLRLNLDKSRILLFSSTSARGELPFLGFTFYWGRNGAKVRTLKLKTTPKRAGKCIEEFTDWIKKTRHRKTTDELWKTAKAKIRGYYRYYGVSFNQPKLRYFYSECVRALFKWLNRRSQRKSFTWTTFTRRLEMNPLPPPPLGAELINIMPGNMLV
jgi:RNA-directed DNA polymerase